VLTSGTPQSLVKLKDRFRSITAPPLGAGTNSNEKHRKTCQKFHFTVYIVAAMCYHTVETE